MKIKLLSLSVLALSIFIAGVISAQSNEPAKKTENTQKQEKVENKNQTKEAIQHGRKFVDENGDGYNDNAPDDDGDGIPNGLDPDYQGSKMQKGKKGFVDLDGDGINDNALRGKGKKLGLGRGIENGNKGAGPQVGAGSNAGTPAGNNSTGGKGRGAQNGKK